MRIVSTATVVQCKMCRSPNRDRIEHWLLRRALREKDDEGRRIDLNYVLARMGELGIVNPTRGNVEKHMERHCQIVEDAEYASLEDFTVALEEQARRLGERFDEQGPANADTLPDRVIQLYDLQMRAELRAGKVPKVTADQVRAMIDTKTRRRQNERLTDLLEIHTAALSGAVGWDADTIDAGPDEFAELVE